MIFLHGGSSSLTGHCTPSHSRPLPLRPATNHSDFYISLGERQTDKSNGLQVCTDAHTDGCSEKFHRVQRSTDQMQKNRVHQTSLLNVWFAVRTCDRVAGRWAPPVVVDADVVRPGGALAHVRLGVDAAHGTLVGA